MTCNPYAITLALDSRSLHGPMVDAALGVVEPTVDLWEAGELTPTRAQLQRLALLTEMPVSWFYRQELRERDHSRVFVCGSYEDFYDPCKCGPCEVHADE